MKNIIILISILGLTSCGFYRQNVVNVPIIKEKGQVQLSGHATFTGFDGQLSYAPTKQFALLANYSDMGTKKVTYSSDNYSIDKHYFGEAGIGYYKKTSNNLYTDFFILAGNGMTSHFVQGLDAAKKVTTFYKQAFYNRFCFQADFGRIHNKFEHAFTPRLMVVNYYNINDSENQTYQGLPNTYLYSDFSYTLRYNLLKFLKISGQINATIPITGYKASYYEFSPFNCSVGIIFNLNFCKRSDGLSQP